MSSEHTTTDSLLVDLFHLAAHFLFGGEKPVVFFFGTHSTLEVYSYKITVLIILPKLLSFQTIT